MNIKNKFLLQLNHYMITNKIPNWDFGSKNAYLAIYAGSLYNDIFVLLKSYIFVENLCLYKYIDVHPEEERDCNILDVTDYDLENYKFFNLNLSKKDYYLQNIPNYFNYNEFYNSAFFYYLKFHIEQNSLPEVIYLFCKILCVNNKKIVLLYKSMRK